MRTPEHLKEAVRAFHSVGIDFVLIGGVAMISHGANALTQDVDLAYGVDSQNLERLAAFLPTIHARVLGRPGGEGFVITADILRRVRFLNLYTDLGEVDIMRDVPGVDSFDALRERAVPSDFGGFVIRVASLDDLIAMKRAANRPKDQSHLYELLALKKLIAEQETL